MTDTPEFRSQPKPEDWIIPPEFEEDWKSADSGIDPIGLALIREHEWDGVPIPLGFKTTKVFVDRLGRLDEGESPAAIADEMIDDWADYEHRYPDTGMWNRGRTLAITSFVERGHLAEAGRVAATVTDARLLVKTVFGLQELIPEETAFGLISGALEAGDQKRRMGVARALRDRLIETEPHDEMIDTFDGLVAKMSGQPDYDMVSDWVASQREAEKDIDWSNTEALLRNDDSYKGMPMSLRMFSHLMFVETIKELADDKFEAKLDGEGWAESVIGYYNDAQDGTYDGAAIWGHELGNIAKMLMEKGYNEAAIEIAAAIRDPRLMATMVLEFAKQGDDEAAIELAARNPDHTLTAELLLYGEYQDNDAAIAKLSEIIQDDDYPAEKRIGCLEVIRDRMLETGNGEGFARYQQMIDDIKKENE
jgi:hypothetical protein